MRTPIKLVWDSEDFLGYEIAGGLYSSIRTLPEWARQEAASLLLEQRERVEKTGYLDDDLARALKIQSRTSKGVGRPTQLECKSGHSLQKAYVDSRGKRQCRACNAERNRLARGKRSIATSA